MEVLLITEGPQRTFTLGLIFLGAYILNLQSTSLFTFCIIAQKNSINFTCLTSPLAFAEYAKSFQASPDILSGKPYVPRRTLWYFAGRISCTLPFHFNYKSHLAVWMTPGFQSVLTWMPAPAAEQTPSVVCHCPGTEHSGSRVEGYSV